MSKRVRIIPCLLLSGGSLVKTVKFTRPRYLGDPLNAVRIFSEKNVDELILLDIDASCKNTDPNYRLITEIASESFMPLAYGGGIKTLEQAKRIIRCGVEKIIINNASYDSYQVITDIASVFGQQSVVGSLDVKKTLLGSYKLVSQSGKRMPKLSVETHISNLLNAGVGELFLNSVDQDGTMSGFDINLVNLVAGLANVPVIACGGAGTVEHLKSAVHIGGASAVAAGSMFVFHGRLKAMLINYPNDFDLYFN